VLVATAAALLLDATELATDDALLAAELATLAELDTGAAELAGALELPGAPLGCVPTGTTTPPATVAEPSEEELPAALDL